MTDRQEYDVIVVGGGPAGLAAALSARENGAEQVLILERDEELGGILNQCIHNGFGLHHFKEELTGPEYAGRFIQQLEGTGIEVMLGAMVLEVNAQAHTVQAISKTLGYRLLRGKSILLAMGCRERTRGAIGIPGTRPAGVFTAGAAQRYVNMEGYMVGKRVLILGSGDIGLIMARRMTLEGAKVLACVEVMPYSGGLMRNIVQCLQDYDIPLYLSHTIIDIQGKDRVERAVVAKVDENRRPIPGTEMVFDCDTILLSVGLIPENELTSGAHITLDPRTKGPVVFENMETSAPGVFACGNVVHVHDLVDFVTAESQRAGAAAARYALGQANDGPAVEITNGEGVGYTVPQKVRPAAVDKKLEIFFRVRRVYGNSAVVVESEGEPLARFKREHLAPGEMEHITLPAALLAKAKGALEVAVEEEQA
ncbi:FAD-dependent oxidoreductase [Gemmiger sp. An194]|uniref:NAD(P)/FAD-dependent oxidoreductase n=1 Tax=Gemmiger sp. An194 TaxID=1965582 RepID=UPI000B366B0C|nr:FAD-dependent oxidoreductase [Gemmiger sp. An194]OUP23214.1 pyridine nucleotide-disulfide oxidoreductase [Gemmiger sp. An194]